MSEFQDALNKSADLFAEIDCLKAERDAFRAKLDEAWRKGMTDAAEIAGNFTEVSGYKSRIAANIESDILTARDAKKPAQ